MQPFRIAINMAGAVSAGAYTAGVLDFLTQALDEWQAAKDRGDDVPRHEVSIEALSGASAGGMCAAIWASMLAQQTSNNLFEAWVNQIDIRRLLTTSDLKDGLVSLLDSSVIETIAREALAPAAAFPRKYVSPSLTLFLTLTNLRGVPYALFEGPTLEPDEYATYHADRLRFEMVEPGAAPKSADAHPLPRGADGDAWALLRTAAMATGAFPVFLAPRAIPRTKNEYARPLWNPSADGPAPAFPAGPNDWTTVNVDGGVLNNSPFALAHEYVSSIDADHSAVITVAPFPGNDAWNQDYDASRERELFAVLGRLVSTILSQARFFGESLASVAGAPSTSRFFIAPSGAPLQCGTLGAFGGFFERSFREHDFQLGRRNCQRFLETSFMGMIPLVGSARAEVPTPAPGSITRASLNEIVRLIAGRANALLPLLIESRLLRWGARLVIAARGRKELKKVLERGLSGSIAD
jgi:predicted acylesterase/phospholipase RssA